VRRMDWVVVIVFLLAVLWPLAESDKSFFGVVVIPMALIGSLLYGACRVIEKRRGAR